MKKLTDTIKFRAFGSIALLIGSLLHFFETPYGKYLFAVGAFILIVLELITIFKHPEADFRSRRLQRMSFMVSLVLALAVYSMVEATTLWIPAVLLYALITLFISFRS